jgi:protein O-GlcNAc transferase
MSVIPLSAAVGTVSPQVQSWSVRTSSGTTLHVPASMQAMSTYVMLEQERWFEPEMSLLPHLMRPGMQALDIGANHGVYTLEMARLAGDGAQEGHEAGHVWAFEPTQTPRTRLLRSLQANELQHIVTVVPAGLSDEIGHVSFAVHENSELNARQGNLTDGEGEQREVVQLDTLDDFLSQHAGVKNIGFIKLDAEGEELRVLAGAKKFFAEQSPVVMFELKHGNEVNTPLIDAWLALGYAMFRWSADLQLLMPFDVATGELACALNLVAVRPAQQIELAARGVLVTEQHLVDARLPALDPNSLVIWCTQPALLGSCAAESAQDLYDQVVAAAGESYAKSFNAVASAHAQDDVSPAQRVLLMRWARETLLADANSKTASAATFGPRAVALVVHTLNALCQPGAAVAMATKMLVAWPGSADADGMPFVVPPQMQDLQRARSAPVGSWLRQMLGEFAVIGGAYSSYFKATDIGTLTQLLQHPDHSPEIERRYLLAHVRHNRSAPLDAIGLLPHPQHTSNPQLWQSVMQMMQPLAA